MEVAGIEVVERGIIMCREQGLRSLIGKKLWNVQGLEVVDWKTSETRHREANLGVYASFGAGSV